MFRSFFLGFLAISLTLLASCLKPANLDPCEAEDVPTWAECTSETGDTDTEMDTDSDSDTDTDTDSDADSDTDSDTDTGTGSDPDVDDDEDGYSENEGDCDDDDDARSPGVPEECDGDDDDCDDVIDDGVAYTYYRDEDGDGYGKESDSVMICAPVPPTGYVSTSGDCDDENENYNPGEVETCTDEEDYNCDLSLGYEDADKDGYAACEECDDADDAVNPDADEECDSADNDCDGVIDEGLLITYYLDTDDDGYGVTDVSAEACTEPVGYAIKDEDCDDSDSAVNPDPSTYETCDEFGLDENCNGLVDDSDSNVKGRTVWCLDEDMDGYVVSTDCSACLLLSCIAAIGYTEDQWVPTSDVDGNGYAACDELGAFYGDNDDEDSTVH